MPCENVTVLCPIESVVVGEACQPQPIFQAETAQLWADNAVEDMIVALSSLETAWCAGEFPRLSKLVETLRELSIELGLTTVADVANTASELSRAADDVALAAFVARLVRVGEGSLAAMFETGYQHV